MEFRILGAIELHHGDAPVPLRAGLERSLLALLLLDAGRMVTRERIVNALWDDPPASATAQVHNVVSRLRKAAGGALARLLVSQGTGYRLDLDGHAFDLAEFRRSAAAGRAAGQPARAIELLTAALACWRGPALADAVDSLAAGLRPALEEERLRATEALLDAQLAAGRPDALLDGVAPLLAEHPHREDLYRRQILALVALGRRADALDAYRRARERLVADLGIEPGDELRELHRQVLDGAAAGAGTTGAAAAGVGAGGRVVPRQLPAAEETLSGRDELLAAVRAALHGSSGGGRITPAVVVLTGPGGIGKSALAMHAAHLHAVDFPDGQLYADLRGAHQVPADPHEIAGRFLRALGVPGGEVAAGRDERAAQYRSALAGRRLLIVLDDARDEAQVRPLLPGASGCAVVITSRRRLDALPLAGAHDVPTLDPASAVRLLVMAAGRGIERGAAAEVVALCGHLPLAIRIAGARLAAHPYWTAALLRDRLLTCRARLDELVVGDLDVRASIALSYRSLPPELAVAFRRLGLVDAVSFPDWLAAVLAGRPAVEGRELVDRLHDHHLVQAAETDQAGQPRFRLHDLVHEFAREAALAGDPRPERELALRRAAHSWLMLAVDADERIHHGALPRPEVDTADAPTVVARERPLDWFEAELSSVLAALRSAGELGQSELASDLALRLKGFCAVRNYEPDNEAAQRLMVEHLRGLDRAVHGERLLRHLRALFWACAEQDRNDELDDICAETIAVAKALGDESTQLDAEWASGQAAARAGRLAESVEIHRECVVSGLRLGRAAPYVHGAHIGLALALIETGDTGAAVAAFRDALAVPGVAGRREAVAQASYAEALIENGQPAEAADAADRAGAIVDEAGDLIGRAHVDIVLAQLDMAGGRWVPARDRLLGALDVVRAHRERHGIGRALLRLGEVLVGLSEPRAAAGHLEEALDNAHASSRPVDVARVHARLAIAWELAGDSGRAAECRRRYHQILDELGLPDACLRMPPHLTAVVAGASGAAGHGEMST